MTSIIKVDTIQNKAGSTSLAANRLPDMLSGSAKVHVSYDGDSNVVDESFNVTSVTDISSGRGDVNFTSAMKNADHTSTGSAGDAGSSAARNIMINDGKDNAASSCRFHVENHSNTVTDASYVGIVTQGDLS